MDQELRERVRKLEDALAQAQNDKSRADEITAGLLRYILDHLTVGSAADIPEAQNRVLRRRLQVLELGCSTLTEGLGQARALNTRLLNILGQQASFSPRSLDGASSGAGTGVSGPVEPATTVGDSGNGKAQPTSLLHDDLLPAAGVEDDEDNLIDLTGEASRQFAEPLDGKSYVRYFNGGSGMPKPEESPLGVQGPFDKLERDSTDEIFEHAEFSQPESSHANTPVDDDDRTVPHPSDDFKPRRIDLTNGGGAHRMYRAIYKIPRGRAVQSSLQTVGPDAESLDAEFYTYGIRFHPIQPTNVYRTVVITELPPTITLSLLLVRVRGGPIYSASLLNTQSITKSTSAMIVFMTETAVRVFVDYVRRHPLLFLGKPAQVTLLGTPTWPIPEAIASWNHTRCIIVGPIPAQFGVHSTLRDFEDKVFGRGTVENVRLDDDRILHIRFMSVLAAVGATRKITVLPAYRGFLHVNFEPDPCAQPLPELPQQGES